MRNNNRGLLLSLFIAVIVTIAIGLWLSQARSTASKVNAPQPVGTGGAVDVEKARERGAAVGETLAVATNKVTESAQEAATTAKVKAKMALDDTVKSRRIDVTTSGTTVMLDGWVESVAEHDRAVALTRDTSGVTGVIDRLTIRVP